MNFARDVASKWLKSYMLRERFADIAQRERMANLIAAKLSSAEKYLSHGRMINARDIQADPELKHLCVEQLGKDDALWKLIWEIYVRSEVFLSMNPNPQQVKAKLFESSSSSLTAMG